MVYGVTPQGFNAKTAATILDELAEKQASDIGPLWNARGPSLIGLVNTSIATQLGAAWEALAAIHKQFDRRDAEGEALDSVGALTGTLRRPHRRTVVTAQCLMVPGTSVVAGQMVAHVVGDTNRRFQNSAAFTVPGSGSTGTVIDVQFESVEFGPIACPATYLTLRDTAVTGWLSINNAADGELGDGVESDEAYKIRQESELAAGGSATQPALIAALSDVDGVSTLAVLVNDTDSTADAIPAHSMEVVISGGDDQQIAEVLFAEKAPGDGTVGSTTMAVTAPDGLDFAVSFSRPQLVNIYLSVTVVATSEFPGASALKTLLAEWGNAAHAPGNDVVPSRVGAKCFELPGVFNVTSARAGTSALGVSTSVVSLGVRQRASFDVSRIAVTVA